MTLGQPKIAQITEKNLVRNLSFKALQLELVVAIIVGVYVILAPFLFELLYPAYKESATLLSQIYALSLLYFPANLFSLGLVKKRLVSRLHQVNMMYFLINALSLIVFIFYFGLIGAVIARVFTRFFLGFLQIYYFYHEYSSE